jgi:myo-inositol catabolism protein IolC
MTVFRWPKQQGTGAMVVLESRQTPKAPNPMYMLAFDHRQVLRDLYPGVSIERLEGTKVDVLDSLDLVAGSVASKRSLAFLVDEEYGAAAARSARERGYYVALPIEASRTSILQAQFPDHRERFERLDPQCVKALVFHNPADDPERKSIQLGLLRQFNDLAREQGRDFLLEVLITPTAEQLERSGGDKGRYRADQFPELLIESIAEMQRAGVEPDVWKVEGLETVDATVAVGAQATSGGRGDVRCIVLGSGESQETVNGWLANASVVPTFSGFAVGRTVWREPLAELLDGRIQRQDALEWMARSFSELIDAFGREAVGVAVDA